MTGESTFTFGPMICPAMRAKMGDRWYYVATMTFAEIARCVQPVDAIHEKKELKTWIQRELRPERTDEIASYICTQKQRFFNALVLGIYDGEPQWQSVGIEETVKIQGKGLDDRQANAFGIVELSGEESIFAIDGQHRVEGIRRAVQNDNSIREEEQVVIFVAHIKTEEGRKRTRRLFSTLNTYARPTTDRERVAISEDDGFAAATRLLIEQYKGLDLHFAPLLPTSNIPSTQQVCITTAVGLYQMSKLLVATDIRKNKRKYEVGPTPKPIVEQIYQASASYWDALKLSIPAIRKVCLSEPSKKLASKYRHPKGGHLLFRQAGMSAFARATRTLMDRGLSAKKAVARLSKVPLELDNSLWREVLWRPENNTMLHKYVRLAHNIFLSQIGEQSDPKTYPVSQQYQTITGREYRPNPTVR